MDKVNSFLNGINHFLDENYQNPLIWIGLFLILLFFAYTYINSRKG